jgi:hypothetical protein
MREEKTSIGISEIATNGVIKVERICGTRILKNARAIQKVAPRIIPASEPLEGFSSLVPLDILKRFHRMSEVDLAGFPELQAARNELGPQPAKRVLFGDPPFRGTLHFVRLAFFSEVSKSTISVSYGDIQTAIRYATLAVQPIVAYTRAYNYNVLDVSPDVLDVEPITVTSGLYNDDVVKSVVNKVLQDNHSHLGVGSPCIILLNPPGMVNTDADPAHIFGYHDKADAPYCFVNVYGTGLTVKDAQDLYADTLSHEIAEMACDPDASWDGTEVCDGCADNCQNDWRNFFDPDPSPANAYVQSFKPSPPRSAFPPRSPSPTSSLRSRGRTVLVTVPHGTTGVAMLPLHMPPPASCCGTTTRTALSRSG